MYSICLPYHFLFTLKCDGKQGMLSIIGRKYSMWLYILHPIFISCIAVVMNIIGIFDYYKYVAPFVVYAVTVAFLVVIVWIKNHINNRWLNNISSVTAHKKWETCVPLGKKWPKRKRGGRRLKTCAPDALFETVYIMIFSFCRGMRREMDLYSFSILLTMYSSIGTDFGVAGNVRSSLVPR